MKVRSESDIWWEDSSFEYFNIQTTGKRDFKAFVKTRRPASSFRQGFYASLNVSNY